MKKFILAAIVAISFNSYAQVEDEVLQEPTVAEATTPTEEHLTLPKYLNQRQEEILKLAEQIAKKDGQREPKLLLGLLMQESSAGGNPHYLQSPDGNYGVAQIRVSAARHVLRDYPELCQEFNVSVNDVKAIAKKLTNDDAFNISVASKYLLILQKAGYSTIKHLALAYNQGAGGAKRFNPDTFPYVRSVLRYVASFK